MIGRREFIALLGGAGVVWPCMARAQQPAMPSVGFLSPTSAAANVERVRGFRQGLKEQGYVEGESLAVLYRWADNQPERLRELAAELVSRHIAVLAVAGREA